ncbi:hypothetical protein [Thermodesulforhabdus norvegica]|uniref:Uncharacterized protein n=1 Tax=Thermodesulforhabdus norvegica TaxID=39841 RepID=A0A1I4VFL5_9BACT|nr:hypothetical protein [Thermodesulforhabdus norvegica]SFM99969.1 hypothetical protein SAMN05660836_02278 [Thermodesulforhabdus norvegica]
MKVEPKVVAAIMGAINLYLQAERAGVVEERRPEPEIRAVAERVVCGSSPWVIAGRQAAMEMRRLWQMRLVR